MEVSWRRSSHPAHTWDCVREYAALDERGRSETLRAARIAETKAGNRGAAIPIGTWITILAIVLGLLYQLVNSNSVSTVTGAIILLAVIIVAAGALNALVLASRDNANEAAHVKALEEVQKAPRPGRPGRPGTPDKNFCDLTRRR